MKKLLSFFFIFIFFFNSINAITILDNYNNADELKNLDTVNYITISSYFSIVATNLTYEIEPARNYLINSKPLLEYVIFNNNDYSMNFSYAVLYKDDESQTYQLNRNLIIKPQSSNYFIVKPEKDYEYVHIYIKCDGDNTCGAGYEAKQNLLIEKPKEVTSVFTPLINGVVDLIQINLSIWFIIYYLFIASIILLIIYLIYMVTKKWYDWTGEHKIFKRSNHK